MFCVHVHRKEIVALRNDPEFKRRQRKKMARTTVVTADDSDGEEHDTSPLHGSARPSAV